MTKRLRLEIECENESARSNADIAQILRRVATRISLGQADSECYQNVFDLNGNYIGTFRLKDEDEESGRV